MTYLFVLDTTVGDIETTLKTLLSRKDIGIVLINQHVSHVSKVVICSKTEQGLLIASFGPSICNERTPTSIPKHAFCARAPTRYPV